MSAVVIAGNTSGTITLDAPNVAGTTVLTLPTTNGTVLTSASSLTASQLPAGSVLQVVNATTSTLSSTSSTSFVATNLTASITPTSSANKILIIVNGIGWASAINVYAYYTIARGTTVLSSGNTGLARFYNNDGAVPISMSWLDSPATTSSTSYTVYFKRGASGTANFVDTTDTGVITLMEIKA